MCGITGFIDFTKKSTTEILRKQCDAMPHRGPDGEGQLLLDGTYAQVGLGHRRLSILDLSNAASQPMAYEHLSIVFNGEIYNYEDIKQELLLLGHTFHTSGDTEMVLHAYKEWGMQCVQKFVGMYALVIFDGQAQEVICLRDRVGIKPFFYYWHQGVFIFGSELKAILAHPAFTKEINNHALAAYLQFGYVPTPHCIWQHTNKIKAGHYLIVSLTTRQVQQIKYWDVVDAYNKPKLAIDWHQAVETTEQILQQACNFRMVADVPVGVFLSGGYDSTTVAALLQKDATTKIKTFTIGVADQHLNEADYAKEIANHLGTDHTEYYCTHTEALALVPELPYFYDEPFADSSAIPTMLVSQLARKHVTVALSADAGDEIFAGYNRYDYLNQYFAKIKKQPSLVKHAASLALQCVPKTMLASKYTKLQSLLKNTTVQELVKQLGQQFTDEQIKKLLVKAPDGLLHIIQEEVVIDNQAYSDLSQMMAYDYQTYLQDDIMQKVDRATMSCSLEGREPFLDQHVIEWAAQLPNQYKYKKGTKKFILRAINQKYIPTSMMERPKMGFGIPIEKWLRTELKPLLHQYCHSDLLERQGIFNAAEVVSKLKKFEAGEASLHIALWHILMFQLWYYKWMHC